MTKGNGKRSALSQLGARKSDIADVWIKPMTIGQFIDMQDGGHRSGNTMMLSVLKDCVTDESGAPYFDTEQDVRDGLSAGIANKLFQSIWALSGFDPIEQDVLKKGLETALVGGSSTSSASPSTAQ